MRVCVIAGDVHADEAGDPCGVEAVAARGIGDGAGGEDLRGRPAAQIEDHAGGKLHARSGEGRIDAALEAVAGVGIDLQAPAGAGGAGGIEIGCLDDDVDGRVGHAGAQAAHDAADALRAVIVADEGFGAVEDVGLLVEGLEAFARAGQADGNRAVDLVGVEDVERAAAVVGEVVGDVDQRGDRAQADGGKAVLQPFRRRAVRHATDHPTEKERAGFGGDVRCEVDRDRAGLDAGDRLDGRCDDPSEAAGGKVAGDAGDGEGVGAVGGDGDLDDGVGGDEVDVAGADLGVRGQLDDAVMGVGELHLALGEHHAVALDAADLADLDGGIDSGDVVAGGGHHHLDAGPRIGRAADDLRLALGRQHLADLELVGVGVLLGFEHMAHGEGREPGCGVLDALDLEAEIGEREGDLVEARLGVEMLLEPGEREFHGPAPWYVRARV